MIVCISAKELLRNERDSSHGPFAVEASEEADDVLVMSLQW